MQTVAGILIALTSFSGLYCAAAQPQRPPKELLPRPASDLRVRFSPDGQYILAQEDGRITVLTQSPFHILFRIPAANASPAEFTPDSRQIVFVSSVASVDLASSSSLAHAERWSIAEQSRVGFAEIRLRGCESRGLSPNGFVLACIESDGTLRLTDVTSGETIFEKRKFGKPFVLWVEDQWRDPLDLFPRHELGDPGSAKIDFSPDSRFVLAMPVAADGTTLALDLLTRRTVSLGGLIKKIDGSFQYSDFAFAGPDRIVLSRTRLDVRTTVAAIVSFPTGKLLWKTKVPPGPLFRAADPRFVLIRPCGPFPRREPYPNYDSDWDRVKRTGACELSTGQLTISSTPALDVFGAHYVSESATGELGLYERGKPAAVATVSIDALRP